MFRPRTPDEPGPPAHSYAGEAALTVLLYWFGLGVSGLAANVLFLRRLRADRAAGRPTRYGGCLWAVLAAHLILFATVAVYIISR